MFEGSSAHVVAIKAAGWTYAIMLTIWFVTNESDDVPREMEAGYRLGEFVVTTMRITKVLNSILCGPTFSVNSRNPTPSSVGKLTITS